MVALAKREKRDTGFGRRLRELRERAGLTQVELGERAGMQYQTVAKYERGVSEPMWSVVLRLADALEVSVDAFRLQTADVPSPDEPADEPPPRRPKKK